MLYVLIVLAVLAAVVIVTLLYLSAAEWVTAHYDAWARRRRAQRATPDGEQPDQDISLW